MIIQVVFFKWHCNPCFKILPFYIRRAEALKLYGLALKASMKQNGDGTSHRAKDDKNIKVSFPSRKWLHLKLNTDNLTPIKANIFYWPQPVDSRDKAAFPDISCFPVYPTCSTFSRAYRWLHVFPRFPPVPQFPALTTGYMFSRAFHLFHSFPRLPTAREYVQFPRLGLIGYFVVAFGLKRSRRLLWRSVLSLSLPLYCIVYW